MDRLLKHARFTLENLMNPKLSIEKRIPIKLLKNAQALIFLTEFKGGFGVGGAIGEGFIFAYNSKENKWSQPCAIGMGGVSLGLQIGAQRTEHIFIVHSEDVLKTFASKGQLKIGGDVSFAIGPLGRDADIALNVSDKGYAPIYSYSMANGAYVGATMQSQLLLIRDDCNEDYFGQKATAKDILFGDMKPTSMKDNSYSALINLIEEYTQNQGEIKNDSYWNEKDRKAENFWSSNEKNEVNKTNEKEK